MRRLVAVTAFTVLASAAQAQDTTVVIVRHLPPQQDTGVVVRHIAPPPQRRPAYAATRNAAGSAHVIPKDPTLGTFLSFVFPGGGQYYADKPGEGLALTMLGIGAPIIGFNSVNHYDRGGCVVTPGFGGSYCHDRTDYAPYAIGLGVGITAWLYGVATAGTDVQRWNQAHGVRFMTAPGRVGFAVAVP